MSLTIILLFPLVSCRTFLLGYITGSARRAGDLEYARPGLTISGAISLAVAEANSGALAPRGLQLRFQVAETFGDEQESIRKVAEMWTRNVSAYIGPQESCVHEGRMAAAFNLPMISYFCTHYETSNKRDFPTFARTRPPDTQISKSVAAVLLHFNWKHVVFFFPNSSDIEYEKVASTILHTFESTGITVRSTKWWDSQYHHGYMENPFHRLVDETFRETRIYVILGHHYEHVGLMVAMEERKLFEKGEYWVVGVDIEQYDEENPTKYLRGLLRDESDPVAQRAFRSYLGIVASSPVGFENFTLAVNKYMEKPPFSFPNPVGYLGGVKRIRAEAAYLYDAVHLYARALIKVLDSEGDPLNGTAIVESIKRCHYRSAMGYMVYMDENGDAEGNYTLLARRRHPHLHNEYGLYPVGMFLPGAELNGTNLPILHLTANIDWIRSPHPPIAVPPCGFRGEKCITHTVEITAGVAGSALLALTIAALVLYRNWKYEQELDSLLWKVDFRDIQVIGDTLGPKGYTRVNHPLVRSSQVSLSSNPDSDFRYSSIFTQVGVYKGRLFAIKKVHKKSIDITREMKKELKMMRDLRHDNLNGFIGACTDSPNICIVTEYCARGSLKDILENEDVKLDNMFIASLVEDILRGMIYLHESPIRFHGALHTANCLVDSRWVVKITDFGLHEFKRGAEDHALKDPERILDECQMLLYRAPEHLRAAQTYSVYDQPKGSQKGDVYSFGIILFELHGRRGPFGDTGLSIAEILHRIVRVPSPVSPAYRPQLECLENSFDFVRECLRECWAENPEDRPELKSIRTKLRPLRKGMKPNIFDNMMAMMEKYANNLEVLVDERTDQLQEEKKKTEALLYEMLPRTVAEQLKKGHKVEAENFDCVTIYFSDIVGFTEMSAVSTPLQIVDFLNDLYTCFDSIIENYDVYKVETIGDAYMVVSGLPISNGDQHAAEIATMSLHLLTEVKQFTIRHMRSEKLKLRIGIHSGPVCAGVVGLKMPRYCLFGDTVNTASRMESSGLPLKIHCSKESKVLLTKLSGYHLIERGVVSMKGKGDQMTYWLIGENIDKYAERSLNRQRKRAGLSNLPSDNNGKMNCFPRSSLKNKNSLIRSPLPRCSSLESPKRLRFASGEHLYHHRNESLLEVINDGSPCKKSCGSLIENSLECCSEALRTSSTSCPCIENLANSSATLAHSQLSVFVRDDKPSYLSVPSLCSGPKLSVISPVQTVSAPVSPNKKHVTLKLPSSMYEYVYNEDSPWNDETPLLNTVLNKENCSRI